MSIYNKLNAARAKFHTLKLTKTGHNKFAGYYYFELGDFLIPAMGVLNECNLCAFISFGKDLATMKIVDMEDNTSIEITSPMSSAALKGCHEVQNLGAVQTYLRRYLWVAALEIVEHDALDSSKPLEPKVTAADVGQSINILNRAANVEQLNSYWKAEVAKFDPKGNDYKELKAAAAQRKTYLQEMAVEA